MENKKNSKAEKEPQNSMDEGKKKKKGKRGIVIIILFLIVLGAGSFGGVYFYLKTQSEKPIVEVKVDVLEELTVNLSDSNSKRYLKTAVTISYDKDDKKASEEITEKTVEIKDKITFYLKSKEATDFESKNEEKLKADLVSELNKLLVKGKIVNVYFPNGLIVQ